MTRTLVSLSLALAAACALTGAARAQGARSFKSGTIQSTADGRAVWVANADFGSVTRITQSGVRAFTVGCSPSGVAVREDGNRAWVTCPAQDRLVQLDAEGQEVGSVAFAYGSGPEGVALSPDQRTLAITMRRSGAVALVDPETLAVRSSVPAWLQPLGIAWQPDGAAAWITHGISDGEATRVSRVDASGRLTASIRLAPQEPQISAPNDLAEGGAVLLRGQLAVRPGTNELWLPAQLLGFRDPFATPDTTAQSSFLVVDTASAALVPEKRVVVTAVDAHDPVTGAAVGDGFDARVSGPVDVAWSRDGRTAWLLHESSNDLLEYPVSAGGWPGAGDRASLRELPVGDRPLGIVVLPQGRLAYVHCSLGRDVAVVDLDRLEVVLRIPLSPPGTVDPLAASGRLLGAKAFFRSDLPEISSNAKVACATCHPGGETDGLIWPEQFLVSPIGPRTTTSLLGLSRSFGPRDGTTGLGQLHRSGDRDEIQDFDFTFRGQQMGGTGFLPRIVAPLSEGYYDATNEGKDETSDSMASFLLALPPVPRSPFRTPAGALTPAAARGSAMFVGAGSRPADANCAGCHVPATGFADRKFHDVGSPRASAEVELASRAPHWKVNTTGLVGIFATPPWDRGCLEGTQRHHLVDAVKDMAANEPTTPHGRVSGLTDRQRRDLAAYLGSLDAAPAPAAVDTTPPRLVRVRPISLTRIVAWFDETVDAVSASQAGNWTVTADSAPVTVESVEWDAQRGDRVILHVSLPRACSGTTVSVRPARILDAASHVTGRSSNVLDMLDPSNTHAFTLGDTLTISLGAGGDADLVVPVQDAGLAGPDDATRMLDSPWLRASEGVSGLVRVDWRDAFVEATGVTDPARLVEARLSLQAQFGTATSVTASRVLRPWGDAHAGDGPVVAGAASWLHSSAPLTWAVPGARSRGGTGDSLADYSGILDVAATPDATAAVADLASRFDLAGPGMLAAHRFWLQHPEHAHGHALDALSGELRLQRSEDSLGDFAPVLWLTYALPAAPSPQAEVSAPGTAHPLKVLKTDAGLDVSFESAAAVRALVGSIGDWRAAERAACLSPLPSADGGMRAPLDSLEGGEWIVVTAEGPCGGSAGSGSLGTPRATWSGGCTR